jgi:hypothetical protein
MPSIFEVSLTTMILLSIFFSVQAFTLKSSHSPQLMNTRVFASTAGYVPEGLTPEQYAKIRQQESEKIKGKNLGKLGPRGFKSRSMQAWQEAYERGEAAHSFASVGYKEKLKLGLMKWEDVPYMIRGGSWDNSDVKGAKNRLKWTKKDREYARGGYKREQSVSILGSGPGFDWTGTGNRDSNEKRLFPGLS